MSRLSNITFRGIPKNYGIVNSFLSRSAQPDTKDFLTLKDMGVTDIIDLRRYRRWFSFHKSPERHLVESLGMKYHHLPSSIYKPDSNNIIRFFAIMEDVTKNGGLAHIHCKTGADRTGMYVFIYKCLHGMGNCSDNIKDWLNYGHHKFLLPHMIKDTLKIFHNLISTQAIKPNSVIK